MYPTSILPEINRQIEKKKICLPLTGRHRSLSPRGKWNAASSLRNALRQWDPRFVLLFSFFFSVVGLHLGSRDGRHYNNKHGFSGSLVAIVVPEPLRGRDCERPCLKIKK